MKALKPSVTKSRRRLPHVGSCGQTRTKAKAITATVSQSTRRVARPSCGRRPHEQDRHRRRRRGRSPERP